MILCALVCVHERQWYFASMRVVQLSNPSKNGFFKEDDKKSMSR